MTTHQRAPRSQASPSVESILEVLLGCGSWEPFRGPTGAALWRMPASDGGTYTVSRVSCTCPYDRYSHDGGCKHRRALAAYLMIEAAILRRDRRSPPPPKETPDSVV